MQEFPISPRLGRCGASNLYGLRIYALDRPQAAVLDEGGAVIAIACDDGKGILVPGKHGHRDGMRTIEDLKAEPVYRDLRVVQGRYDPVMHAFLAE